MEGYSGETKISSKTDVCFYFKSNKKFGIWHLNYLNNLAMNPIKREMYLQPTF